MGNQRATPYDVRMAPEADVEVFMPALAATVADSRPQLDYSVGSVDALSSWIASEGNDDASRLRAAAYVGQVLCAAVPGARWVPSTRKHPSSSGAPQIKLGRWNADPLELLTRDSEDRISSRLRLCIETLGDPDSAGLQQDYKFPTAWQQILKQLRRRHWDRVASGSSQAALSVRPTRRTGAVSGEGFYSGVMTQEAVCDAWRIAGEKLGIRVEAPAWVTLQSESVECAAFLPDFGSVHGTVAIPLSRKRLHGEQVEGDPFCSF